MQRIEPTQWHEAVAQAIANGSSNFVTLMALDDGGVQVWLRLRDAAGTDVVLTCDADSGVDTIIDLLPEAAWSEREAAEMFGIRFDGHATAPLLLEAGAAPVMRRTQLLEARQSTPWPGEKEPGGATPRRRQRPPGVEA